MRRFNLIPILLISINCFSQCISPPHGTLLFAIICQDGILLSADSRSSFDKGLDASNNKIWYAHTDSVRKIFPLGNFQIMMTGPSSYKNQYIENLITSFNKKSKPDSSVRKTFENFKKYVINKTKITDSIFNLTAYVVAGYEKGVPKILYADSANGKGITILSKILHRVFSVDCAEKYYYTILPICSYQLPMIENMFKKSSEEEIFIGGPINIVKINKDNSFTELKTFPFAKPYKDAIAFYRDVVAGKVSISYHYKWSKEWLMLGINCAIKCPQCN